MRLGPAGAAALLGALAACGLGDRFAEGFREGAGRTRKDAPHAVAPAAPVAARQDPDARPPLEVRQGSYFRWALPAGWRASESMSGVDLKGPEPGWGAASVILMRSPGASSPQAFAQAMLSRVPGITGLRLVAVRGRSQQPSGYPGMPWAVEELELAYRSDGVPVRALWTCGVVNILGRSHDAFLAGCMAPEARFERVRDWLWPIVQSVKVTNVRQVAGNDTVLMPRNNPLDNSGLIAAWRRKGLSEDRISQARREGTMGYERMQDPATGRVWNMPLESYDGTVGGYRNPNRPTEILVKPRPGE